MAEIKRLYNTGPCAPRIIKVAAEGLGLEPEKVEVLQTSMVPVDNAFASMLAVAELAHFLPAARKEMSVTPLVYPGVYDRDTDKMFHAALMDWYNFADTSNLLIAGQHVEVGQRPKLAADRLQEIFDSELPSCSVKVHSQANADNAPHQAEWGADMIMELGLEAVAVRAHPFHGARAYLTQLAVLKKRGLDRQVVLLPWWNHWNPFAPRPLTEPWPEEVWSDASLIPGEAWRIADYSAKGDVASLAVLKEYVDWLASESRVAACFGVRTTEYD